MHIGQFALGAVAAFVFMSAAHAGDAIVPNEFDEQQAMSACDAYGTGFAKLPGTDTCARISGQVRYEKHFSGSNNSGGRTTLTFETRSD